MSLKLLALDHFRNYGKRQIELGNRTIIVGKNGAGKSNILEAIYLLATGKSFRADKDGDMVQFGNQVGIVSGEILTGEDKTQVKVTLTDGTIGYARKKFEVNGIARRQSDAVGKLKAVLFSPADMELLTGSPSKRRKYLDFVLVQKDKNYGRSLVMYEKGLRQRNKLLDLIREGKASRSQLVFWDMTLIKHGNYLTEARAGYINKTNMTDRTNTTYQIVYDKSTISPARLAQYANEEVASATTLVGPHRDDFWVEMVTDNSAEKRNVADFGSRGQQRMGVLWLKQAELSWLTIEEQYPVLLLDDIFSELDHTHREEVRMIATFYPGQVIFTTADEHLLPDFGEVKMIRLE